MIVTLVFHTPAADTYEEQNVALGQSYLSQSREGATVLVGSSMSGHVSLGPPLNSPFNLAFVGRGPFDGLSVIASCENVPAIVVIETNTVFRAENTTFTSKIISPWGRHLHRGNHEKPVNYVVRFLAWMKPAAATAAPSESRSGGEATPVNQPVAESMSEDNEEPASASDAKRDDPAEQLRQQFIEEWTQIPEWVDLDARMAELEDRVQELRTRGATVIFHEMPCDSRIDQSERFQQIRNAIDASSVLHDVPVIRDSEVSRYETTDGMHLTEADGYRFSEFFIAELQRLVAQ